MHIWILIQHDAAHDFSSVLGSITIVPNHYLSRVYVCRLIISHTVYVCRLSISHIVYVCRLSISHIVYIVVILKKINQYLQLQMIQLH